MDIKHGVLAILLPVALGIGYLLPHKIPIMPVVVTTITPNPVPPATGAPGAPKVSTEGRARLFRAMLKQVAKDWGIKGTLDCRVVEKRK